MKRNRIIIFVINKKAEIGRRIITIILTLAAVVIFAVLAIMTINRLA